MNYFMLFIICCFSLFFLLGCATPHVQMRTVEVEDNNASLGSFVEKSGLQDKDFKKEVGGRIIENYEEFALSVVEFDDQGKFWNKRQQLDALHELVNDKIAKQNGAIILVFVHGWQENCDVLNPTVSCFRQLLYHFSLDEKSRNLLHPRRIIGVYVGWRGRSERLPFLSYLTFWNRKETAHKIGRGDMDELLVHLEDLKKGLSLKDEALANKTRLVIVGHSFGGAMVYSAFDNILKNQAAKAILPYLRHESDTAEIITAGNTDLVVLVNPAFEALLYSGLAEITGACKNYNPKQTTLLMTIGAVNDSATKIAFPIGNFFPALWQKFKPNSDERKLYTVTIGNYNKYINYRLSKNPEVPTPAKPFTAVQRKGKKFNQILWEDKKFPSKSVKSILPLPLEISHAPEGAPWKLKSSLSPVSQKSFISSNSPISGKSPFLVISVTKDIINGHGGIWGDTLLEFLRDFIAVEDQEKD